MSLTPLPDHAMINQYGDLFYPDNADDARHFAAAHNAWAVLPLRFPWLGELADMPWIQFQDLRP